MRTTVPDHVQVKTAGGAPGLDTLVSLAAAGAAGLGAPATAAILDDLKARHLGH
jgi:deoxyribose-phosphate aldolase